MIKLAMSGKMRAGKDCATDYLVDRLKSFGLEVERLAFAGTLKRIAEYAQREAGLPVVKDRELLQYLGAEWGRKHDPDVWVKALERQIKEIKYEDYADAIVVTDCRFPNEVEMLRRNEFTLVRIGANTPLRIARGAAPDTLNHISEIALDELDRRQEFDWMIQNEGTVSEFHQVLDTVINRELLEKGY